MRVACGINNDDNRYPRLVRITHNALLIVHSGASGYKC